MGYNTADGDTKPHSKPDQLPAHLHYAFKPSARGRHLLVQLRTLRKARGLTEVVGDEHFRATLGRPSEQLGAVDL